MNNPTQFASSIGAFRQYLDTQSPRPWLHWSIQILSSVGAFFSLLLGLGLLGFAIYLQIQWGPHMVLQYVRGIDPVLEAIIANAPFQAIESLAARIGIVMQGAEALLASLGLLSLLNAILLVMVVRARARAAELQAKASEFTLAAQASLAAL